MDSHRALLERTDPEVAAALAGEERRQCDGIELIPSENYTYPEVLAALGSVFTNKYAEGYPGRRYYGGQQFTDDVEQLARERARRLFRAAHANVQPLSGSPMNQAVYLAFLDPGDTIVGMDLSHGGHLTHGAPVSHMGKIFRFVRYKTCPDQQGRIDFEHLREIVLEARPKILLCGYTSYPRDYDYAQFKLVADEVGAITMADVAQIGGLIAAGVMENPLDHGFDIVTTTLHKTLRGPRAGMILCRKPFAKQIDSSVFPGLQGGPHMHTIAASAVALGKALEPGFADYGARVLRNAKALAAGLSRHGAELVTGGTDNHMMVVDTVKSFGIDGRQAEAILDRVAITVNKQIIPDDPNPPLRPSGIRLGSPAATTRGMDEADMEQLAEWICAAISHADDERRLGQIATEAKRFCSRFPVPGIS